jgi:hypothetical protein
MNRLCCNRTSTTILFEGDGALTERTGQTHSEMLDSSGALVGGEEINLLPSTTFDRKTDSRSTASIAKAEPNVYRFRMQAMSHGFIGLSANAGNRVTVRKVACIDEVNTRPTHC